MPERGVPRRIGVPGERAVEPPSDADPARLSSEVRRELRALGKDLGDRIGRHLVAAGELVDEAPELAYRHALAAKAAASRIGVVREAVGVTAYAAGDFATALAELRAARRLTGSAANLPLIADCERALGRPARALEIGRDPEASRLDRETRVELAIVLSGARRDLGQPAAAVLELQLPELGADQVEEWTVRLWYAYADALLAAGRSDDAREWFAAVASVDEEDTTDAAQRLARLGG